MKAGITVEEDVWMEVKDRTFRVHGTLRRLSAEVSRLLRAELPRRALRQGAEAMDVPPRPPSPEALRRMRPRVRGSSADLVHTMRSR
ncbi:MAG: hypothetical protein HY558_07285 [Euryarchaeota archaeon]|nr:hypothetical protein [Euryarchaeota archaeon]